MKELSKLLFARKLCNHTFIVQALDVYAEVKR
jgi:hypothetical protein